MHFLPNVYVTCEACKGRRYNRETLEIQYRGRSIADMLRLTVDQALPLVENFPSIAIKLRTLQRVGLGYLELGQSATTLSGGEAQRVKLARELSRRGTGRTLYILDEPTTGLHFDDTRNLLDVLHQLVEQGNTAVVIEHNLDVIRSADWVIDLGPEGGAQGGKVVAQGTPEQIEAVRASHTGRFLREHREGLGTAKLA
jgi:excinuclease ABC subunit A